MIFHKKIIKKNEKNKKMSKIREKRARKKIIKKPQKNCKKHRAQKKKNHKKKMLEKEIHEKIWNFTTKNHNIFFWGD